MSTYTSTLQRRKTAKAKTNKQTENNATENNINTNERLQLRSISDKLGTVLRQQKLQQKQKQWCLTTSTSATTPLCCNGSIPATAILSVSCCRDINCRLNVPPLRGKTIRKKDERITERRSSSHSSMFERDKFISPLSIYTKEDQIETPATEAISETIKYETTNLGKTLASSVLPTLESSSLDVSTLEKNVCRNDNTPSVFTVDLQIDLFSWILFVLAVCTRFYKLAAPPHVVFDEVHYGKYISHYMRNVFFFDQHPPLGKQLIATVLTLAGYDGNFTFTRIGAQYAPNVPVFWMRFVPALCGSLLAPAAYKLLLEAQLKRWSALMGGLLIILDNALLTQSRFILMESMLLLFCTFGVFCLLKFRRCDVFSVQWLFNGIGAAFFLACAVSVKYVGFYTLMLAFYVMCRFLWDLILDPDVSDFKIVLHTIGRILLFTIIPCIVYLGIFYIHLRSLHRAGPHDSFMTSAFQASLDGGLASITRGQPLKVAHGSQITLRHTYGRTCWLHSHPHVYPVRYPDKRGSSHQQQVTCYSFKDVNNWWIVKRPERDDLVVEDTLDVIKHGDVIQLVHGITSRALNSHDVAAPMTPQCQEVSCYIDYAIKMEGELLWRVEILNRNTEGDDWHAIKSEIRLIHETTGAVLRFTGRLLPDWAFHQHEIVADRDSEQKDSIWNVEEHRYTKSEDQREREKQLLAAEMIPTQKTKLSFWSKFIEVQMKMFWNVKQIEDHMYSSEPYEWPLLEKTIAYWLDTKSNAQIHLLGNILIWYSGTFGLLGFISLGVFYILRRQRLCFDLPTHEWQRFVESGDYFFIGFLVHYLPHYFAEEPLFLHHYLPAYLFKLFLLVYVFDHIDFVLKYHWSRFSWLVWIYRLLLITWLSTVIIVFVKFLPLSYGTKEMTANDIINLRWKDTWDFIIQKNYILN